MMSNIGDCFSVVMLGPPGSGKGTQVEAFKKMDDFFIVSVGDLLRRNADVYVHAIGSKVSEIMQKGMLLPDSFICSIIEEEIVNGIKLSKKIVFDGFPRTVEQAKNLQNILNKSNIELKYVFNFVIDDSMIIKRIIGRFICAKCGKIYNKFLRKTKVDGICDDCGSREFLNRSDDNENSLKVRLSQYCAKSVALVGFYSDCGVLININADRDSKDIRDDLFNILLKV